MKIRRIVPQSATALLVALVCGATPVAADKLYKWMDKAGNIHYTQQPPPAQAKAQEHRKFGDKPADPGLSYSLQLAVKEFPATIYMADGAEVCAKAMAHLKQRGVPFTSKNVREPANGEELKALIGGKLEIPILKLGTQVLRGYDVGQWDTALDAAGYPAARVVARPGGALPQPGNAVGEGDGKPQPKPAVKADQPAAGIPTPAPVIPTPAPVIPVPAQPERGPNEVR